MYRDRIENLTTRSRAEQRLKQVLISYHDFKNRTELPVSEERIKQLADWQCQRLINSHADLYHSENYNLGVRFLFSDLYAPKDFSDRDRDLERIAPKLVKLLPDKVIHTLAHLIELNLQTQQLDTQLADQLFNQLHYQTVDHESYCHAYRACDNKESRHAQLENIQEVGKLLNKYARSRMLHFSLSISEKPADMAGLSALYQFLRSGFDAFHYMQDIPFLMQTLIQRERQILENIFANKTAPFEWNDKHHD